MTDEQRLYEFYVEFRDGGGETLIVTGSNVGEGALIAVDATMNVKGWPLDRVKYFTQVEYNAPE